MLFFSLSQTIVPTIYKWKRVGSEMHYYLFETCIGITIIKAPDYTTSRKMANKRSHYKFVGAIKHFDLDWAKDLPGCKNKITIWKSYKNTVGWTIQLETYDNLYNKDEPRVNYIIAEATRQLKKRSKAILS